MNEHELDSLIALLDDPDDSVFNLVLHEILKKDISVVDHLEHIWETSMDGLVQQRLEFIIQQIQFNDTRVKIKNWANQSSIDLFEGFFLITRYYYPELKLKPIKVQLDKIKKDIWLEFRNSQTSLEKITIINHIFFHHYKFAIDRVNPDSPQNCFINRILDFRKGNPISIAILYTLIARSLGLPVHYIDIENTPLIGYFDKDIAQLVELPGIGKKMAERLVLESAGFISSWVGQVPSSAAPILPHMADAIAALIHLGYKPKEATPLIEKLQEQHHDWDREALLRQALKILAPV